MSSFGEKHAARLGPILSRIALAAGFGLALAACWYFDVSDQLTLASLQAHRDSLMTYTEAHYATAVLLFIALYCLTAALSVPGDIILTIAGGLLFGSVLGTLYVNIGATAGATLAFLSARYFLRDWVEAKFGGNLGRIQERFARDGFSYLVSLRLIPAFPFVLVNLVSGLTRIKLSTYMLGTSLGMIPASFVFANAGRQLGMISSVEEIASPAVIGSFALLGLLALVPIAYRRLAGREPLPEEHGGQALEGRKKPESLYPSRQKEVTSSG